MEKDCLNLIFSWGGKAPQTPRKRRGPGPLIFWGALGPPAIGKKFGPPRSSNSVQSPAAARIFLNGALGPPYMGGPGPPIMGGPWGPPFSRKNKIAPQRDFFFFCTGALGPPKNQGPRAPFKKNSGRRWRLNRVPGERRPEFFFLSQGPRAPRKIRGPGPLLFRGVRGEVPRGYQAEFPSGSQGVLCPPGKILNYRKNFPLRGGGVH